VPAHGFTPCNEGNTVHNTRRGETSPTGPLYPVYPGSRSRAETGGARYGGEVVCGRILWSAQRWKVSYGVMRGAMSSKQDIVVTSSMEGELVAASNSANQGLHSR
jgi:hypothetical protein